MIYVVDFGSQTAHLIARRLKDLGVEAQIVSPEEAPHFILQSGTSRDKAKGIIFSGGPSSVYEKGAPTIDVKIFSLGIPILGICYGLQLTAHLLGGKVIAGKKEYGPTKLKIQTSKVKIAGGLPDKFTVWMSHGDEVIRLPNGFKVIGSTDSVPFAFAANFKKNIYGVQFHPEVEHTEFGTDFFRNFIKICDIDIKKYNFNISKIEDDIRKKVGKSYVIGALSGGVDSAVAGILASRAIGKQFIPIYVDNGLMRDDTKDHVKKIFKIMGMTPYIVKVRKEMINKLKGITDPEKKRKIIGNFYIEIFEREMKKNIKKGKDVKFLLQGTIYSDVIESQGTEHSSKIKSHHNVGGLPKKMKLKLLEPMRDFYKDEVREIGRKLGLPEEFIYKQPFPGPGYAIRIRGEVTNERLRKEIKADVIVLDELRKAKILENIFISFPILTQSLSTAVKGDGRFFGEVVAIRILESKDVMTANWADIPYDVLQKISSRIVNEVPGVSRVVYDITTKPPATMEWE